MASLNTLRTKGGWFLTGVILIALLAFILGDLGSCRGNQNPVVGEINGVRINYSDYMQERQNQENILKLMGNTNDQNDMASENAWVELIMRHSFVPGFVLLGLTNSEQEQIDMNSGVHLSPVLMSFFRNPETGMFDPDMLRYFVENMGPQQRALWVYIQQQMNSDRKMSKYNVLVANGLMINDLEVASGVSTANNTVDARVIFKPYSSIADSLVNITTAEIKEYFNAHQNKFRRNAARDIEYVVFDIAPSAEDMAAGQKRVDELAAQFAVAENPVTFVTVNSLDDRTPPTFVRESEVESAIAATLLGNPDAMYGPVLSGETFTMARLAETRMIPDSVTFSMIVVRAADKNLADSLVRVANRNNFAELARTYSLETRSGALGGDMGTFDPLLLSQQNPKVSDALINAQKGQIVTVEEDGALFLIDVVNKTAPVKKVKIATLKYTVRPSSTTHSIIMNQATEFFTKANGSYDNFKNAANEMALPKRVARINNSERNVSGIENSISLVRWAFENKKGTVSEPEEFENSYIVVAVLTNVIEEGIASIEEVTPEIRTLLSQRKKGAMIAEQLTGSSLDAIAQANNLDIIDAEGVTFSGYGIPGFGMEPRLVGAIASATQTGRLSAPVKGNQGVFLFEATNIMNSEETSADDVRLRMESIAQYFLNDMVMKALHEKSNIVDNRVRYF